MLIFVIGVISIDIIQEWKTDKTLRALKDLSAPHISVLRDGKEQRIASEDLVPGDLMLICEGIKIPSDGKVVKCSDLCVDESTLTYETEAYDPMEKAMLTYCEKMVIKKFHIFSGELLKDYAFTNSLK